MLPLLSVFYLALGWIVLFELLVHRQLRAASGRLVRAVIYVVGHIVRTLEYVFLAFSSLFGTPSCTLASSTCRPGPGCAFPSSASLAAYVQV